jgi:U4/U6.U5 tri-snRNP component SNU23
LLAKSFADAIGKKPRFKTEDLPKATKALQAREEDLEINKNLNKTVLVSTTTTGKGPRGAGFYVSDSSVF